MKRTTRKRKRDMDIAAVDQLARNAEVVFGYAGYVMIWTMAMTGMRPGELFGLRREYRYSDRPGSDPCPGRGRGRAVRRRRAPLRQGRGPHAWRSAFSSRCSRRRALWRRCRPSTTGTARWWSPSSLRTCWRSCSPRMTTSGCSLRSAAVGVGGVLRRLLAPHLQGCADERTKGPGLQEPAGWRSLLCPTSPVSACT